jgi:ABC-type sulfate transport system permease subunit
MNQSALEAIASVGGIISFLIGVLMIAAMWKLFTKANRAGWKAIIPIYNTYIMLKIVGRPGWWLVLLLIPFVNIIFAFILAHDIAQAYGKGMGFTIGLILLPIIFLPILGFGSSQYAGPVANTSPQRNNPQNQDNLSNQQ